jgi:peptide/nickel transport system permease protein
VGFVAVGISVLIGIIMGGIAGYFGQNRFSLDAMLKTLGLALAGGLWWLGLPGPALLAAALTGAYWLAGRRSARLPGELQSKGVTVDTLVMRFVDIMLCFPSFFLILTVIALLPASIYNIMIVIGLTSWMGTARFVRAEFLSLREQDFVTATKALGLGHARIIFQHMLPNAVAPVMVSATIGIATAILTEAGLSFLGFGVPPPQATWGNILSEGKNYLFDAPWLTLIPGLAILVVVLAFNLFGEGLRDALNPRLRK